LHATLLGFRHPATGEILRFESPLPPDLGRLAQALRDDVAL
jgi:23S rRNA pseudouridine1911/1915/1917 synthase